MRNNVKIIVTGADGQLGKEFARELNKSDINHLAFDKDSLDITDFKKVNEVIEKIKPDFVINCAAFNDVDGAEKEWQKAFLVNGVAARNLVLACNRNNSVFVHYSSDYVFDGKKGAPYTIADAPGPINKYGESKRLGERNVEHLSERYYLIRLSWVFGENPKASFPLKLMERAKTNKTLKIVNDQISSPAFVEDITKATLDLIGSGQYGLYHLANEGFCSRYEWAKYVLEKLKWQGELLPAESGDFETPAQRPRFSALDNFPLKSIISYKLPAWQEATDKFLKRIQKNL